MMSWVEDWEIGWEEEKIAASSLDWIDEDEEINIS